MVSVSYLLYFLALYFILMQICSSMVIDDRYSPSIETENNDDEQNDDQVYVAQRSAHFIFPPTSFISASNRLNDYHPNKRQSFGRKHHWDAFFGRR